MKKCVSCKIEKPQAEFHKNSRYRDGLNSLLERGQGSQAVDT